MSTYKGKPPFDLVQLSTFPPKTWRGRPVFHPMSQAGGKPYWRDKDYEADHGCLYDPGDPEYAEHVKEGEAYDCDVGIVVDFEKENWRGEPENPGSWEVYFLVNGDFALHYAADNLWTPKDGKSQGKTSS